MIVTKSVKYIVFKTFKKDVLALFPILNQVKKQKATFFSYRTSSHYSKKRLLQSRGISSFCFSRCRLRLIELIKGSNAQRSLLIRSSFVFFLDIFLVKNSLKFLNFLLDASCASSESIPIGISLYRTIWCE